MVRFPFARGYPNHDIFRKRYSNHEKSWDIQYSGFLTSGGSHAATDETAADGRCRHKSHQRQHSTPRGAGGVENWLRHCKVGNSRYEIRDLDHI